jgi:NAD(P)-dependent dehydrogenase (short-subunit alcohol dehydrogenase family)
MTPMTTGIRTPFDFSSTADDVIDGIDLSGHRAIVTGGSSGIGVETARALASAGAEVTLAVRRTAAGDHVAAELVRSTGNEAISVQPLELSDQRSVTRFVDRWTGPLHILVNNAGIMANPELERTDFRPYDPFVAYGQFKSADALLAVEATRRWSGQGIYANAVNPGAIATNLQRHTGGLRTPENRRKTPRQGASTSVLLAASPLLNGVGGRYFEDNNEARTVTRRPEDYTGVAWYALDPANAERLWITATDLLS